MPNKESIPSIIAVNNKTTIDNMNRYQSIKESLTVSPREIGTVFFQSVGPVPPLSVGTWSVQPLFWKKGMGSF
jgi:hypothetical protein